MLAAPAPSWNLEDLRAGDEQAFGELVDSLHPSMFRLASALLGDARHAQDLVQDVWVAVIDGLDGFEERSSLKTWVLRILTNRARTLAVKLGRAERLGWMEEDADEGERALPAERFRWTGGWRTPPRPWASPHEDPESALMRLWLREVLSRSIDALPPGQRAVVVLRDVEGLDAGESAAVLGLTESNLRVLLHRGRSKLRTMIEAELADVPSPREGQP